MPLRLFDSRISFSLQVDVKVGLFLPAIETSAAMSVYSIACSIGWSSALYISCFCAVEHQNCTHIRDVSSHRNVSLVMRGECAVKDCNWVFSMRCTPSPLRPKPMCVYKGCFAPFNQTHTSCFCDLFIQNSIIPATNHSIRMVIFGPRSGRDMERVRKPRCLCFIPFFSFLRRLDCSDSKKNLSHMR